MTVEPKNLAQLQRDRLRAQADVFAALASHGTIVGTAREIALMDFFRGIVPRKFEVLSGAIVETVNGEISQATDQLDLIVVDTFQYPTLLRTGDLAIVLPESVRVVVEVKSNLNKGQEFFDALTQIGKARLLAAQGTLTVLFCFGAPTGSGTLRGWLNELTGHRDQLKEWALAKPEDPQKGKEGTERPERYKKKDKEYLLGELNSLSAAALPDLILADNGAIAMRNDQEGKTQYDFYETKEYAKKEKAPSIVALASKVLAQVSDEVVKSQDGMKVLIAHYDDALIPADGVDALDVGDTLPTTKEA